jgi:predicted transglutaminase-like cysteine proteinase
MLILSGTLSGSAVADGTFAWPPPARAPLAAEAPIVVAFADGPAARIEPAVFESMESVVAPLVNHDDGMATSAPTRRAVAAKRASQAKVATKPPLTGYGPARFFTINQVLAKGSAGAASAPVVKLAAIGVGQTTTDAAPMAAANTGTEPFGLFTFRAPEGRLWVNWRKVEADLRAEAPILARCRTEPEHCAPAAARFNAIVADAKAAQGRARLALVNERVNAAIRYTSDAAQHGVADLWSAPLESLASGRGDCEDYAIAKYAILRDAGLADRDLHLLLVRDNAVRLDHAVLAVRDAGQWLILDNRWDRPTADTELHQFAPLFALDEQGVKLFAAPYAALEPQDLGTVPDGDSFVAGANAGGLAAVNNSPDAELTGLWAVGLWATAPLLL